MFLENTKEFITMVKSNEVEKVISILERANREFNYLGDIINDNSYSDFKDKYLVHQFDFLGMTPLHHAAKNNNFEMVKILCHYKSYVNKIDQLGRTPMYLATKNGNYKIVKYLIQQQSIP